MIPLRIKWPDSPRIVCTAVSVQVRQGAQVRVNARVLCGARPRPVPPAPSGANKKSVPRGAPMQHLARVGISRAVKSGRLIALAWDPYCTLPENWICVGSEISNACPCLECGMSFLDFCLISRCLSTAFLLPFLDLSLPFHCISTAFPWPVAAFTLPFHRLSLTCRCLYTIPLQSCCHSVGSPPTCLDEGLHVRTSLR